LLHQGLRLIAVTRWHWSIGELHSWPAVGRWQDLGTGQHGKFRSMIAELIELQLAADTEGGK
jgi:hypothetical protein